MSVGRGGACLRTRGLESPDQGRVYRLTLYAIRHTGLDAGDTVAELQLGTLQILVRIAQVLNLVVQLFFDLRQLLRR